MSLLRSKQFVSISVAFVVILVMTFGSLSYLNSQKDYEGKAESITYGHANPGQAQALVYIAQNQHFFLDNGLNVTIKYDYVSGIDALNALVKNEVDIASSTEYAVVQKAFQKANVSIMANHNRQMLFTISGRKDRGIENITDLKGKTIGLAPQTIEAFYLGRFLKLHGISLKDVNLVNVQGPQKLAAISNGSVDAVVSPEPYTYQIQQKLTNEVVSWSIHSDQTSYGVYVGRNEWITQHPELVDRFLKSISRAQDYLISHPAEAQAIMQGHFNYSDEYMAFTWSETRYGLSLDQSLILAMEDEARWMINNNLTGEKKTPDFLDYINSGGLNTIRPESVNIIR